MIQERTALTILNDDHNQISPIWPGEHFVRLYDGKLPFQEGLIVKVEGTFWIEKSGSLIEANCTGFYKARDVGRSPNPDYDQIQADLVRIVNPVPTKPYLVLPQPATNS